jgi:hypothetical protein
MTEAEFRKKAEAIKERYSKFVFYFDKRQKKNFVLFLSEISIPTACHGENIFVCVSSIKLHMPKTQETDFTIRLFEPKINNYHKMYFSPTNCNLAYDSIENIFERIDNTLKQYIKLKKDLLKRKLEKL